MSDKLKQTWINTTFAGGEQVTPAKINGALRELENAIEFTNKAIGDINNQQYPHTNAASQSYPLGTLPSAGPNINRILGSVSWLNPRRLSLVRKTISVDCIYKQSVIVDGVTDTSNNLTRSVFRLPFTPVVISKNYTPGDVSSLDYQGRMEIYPSWVPVGGGTWTIGAPSVGSDASSKVVSRHATTDQLTASGDYHVSEDGVITVYDPLDSGEGFSVTYSFDSIGDSFSGATLNIIPDFAQTPDLCTVTDNGDGTYEVVFPTISAQSGNFFFGTIGGYTRIKREWVDSKNSGITSGLTSDISGGEQAVLPEILTTYLSSGDTIPEGYILLWDETLTQALSGGTFTYINNYTVRVSSLILSPSTNRYRIIVPGADNNRILSVLRESYAGHDHSDNYRIDGTFTGSKIWHFNLLGTGDEGDGTMPPMTSSVRGPVRQCHPQYLHRMGYDSSDGGVDSGNRRNAMLGDFLLSASNRKISLGVDSYSLHFGSSSGPTFWYDQSDDTLNLSNKALTINATSPTAPTAPESSTIYSDIICKAKGYITTGGTPALAAGFNISSSISYNGNAVVLTFLENIPHPYVPMIMNEAADARSLEWGVQSSATGSITIACYDYSGSAAVNLSSTAEYFYIIIM